MRPVSRYWRARRVSCARDRPVVLARKRLQRALVGLAELGVAEARQRALHEGVGLLAEAGIEVHRLVAVEKGADCGPGCEVVRRLVSRSSSDDPGHDATGVLVGQGRQLQERPALCYAAAPNADQPYRKVPMDVEGAVQRIREDGYAVVPDFLDDETTERLQRRSGAGIRRRGQPRDGRLRPADHPYAQLAGQDPGRSTRFSSTIACSTSWGPCWDRTSKCPGSPPCARGRAIAASACTRTMAMTNFGLGTVDYKNPIETVRKRLRSQQRACDGARTSSSAFRFRPRVFRQCFSLCFAAVRHTGVKHRAHLRVRLRRL